MVLFQVNTSTSMTILTLYGMKMDPIQRYVYNPTYEIHTALE